MTERLLTVAEARGRILDALRPLPTEDVNVQDAIGRALAVEVIARRTLPPWDNSAMDGYAVRAEDVRQAPVVLRLGERIFAGQLPSRALAAGEAARIMTGAPLPKGSDAVVMQERTRPIDSERVEVLEPVSEGSFVRAAGEDAREGELLFARGTPLAIPQLSMLLAQGLTQVKVPRRVRAAVLSTGDELVDAGASPGPGQIVDTNGPALCELLRRAGAEVSFLGIAKDDAEEVSTRLRDIARFDVVLTSAGVSVGEKDAVKAALDRIGARLHLWRVAIKPGKPLAFGSLGQTAIFGLPGNPTSSLVGFELFVRPALRRLGGIEQVEPERVPGRTAVELRKAAGLTHFLRVTSEWRDGGLWARPLGTQTSGALRSAASATHLLVFSEGQTVLTAGAEVELLPVHWGA